LLAFWGGRPKVPVSGVFFYVDAWPEQLSQIEFALMFSENTCVSCRGRVVRVEELASTGMTGVAATIDSHDLASRTQAEKDSGAVGATDRTITAKGENYLRALERFECTGVEPVPAGVSPYERNTGQPRRDGDDEWDVFVSHASEDKDAIARPLAEALRTKGLRVWYDEFSLTVGDSLRKKIDQGLANSRFGIVILSPHFFEKHWPKEELDELATREVGGKKVVLPVWHRVGFNDVRQYSQALADRIAVSTNKGVAYVVEGLLSGMK
jgi:hypothetical protein